MIWSVLIIGRLCELNEAVFLGNWSVVGLVAWSMPDTWCMLFPLISFMLKLDSYYYSKKKNSDKTRKSGRNQCIPPTWHKHKTLEAMHDWSNREYHLLANRMCQESVVNLHGLQAQFSYARYCFVCLKLIFFNYKHASCLHLWALDHQCFYSDTTLPLSYKMLKQSICNWTWNPVAWPWNALKVNFFAIRWAALLCG